MSKLQIVVDTNVLVAALRSKRGAASHFLSILNDNRWQLHVSNPLILEYEDVLKRDEMQEFISNEEADEFIDAICSISKFNRIFFLWRLAVRDPSDAFVFELAVRCQADFLVTFNVNDFPHASEFGVRLVTPREFLAMIGEMP